jgi:hypothetical protein
MRLTELYLDVCNSFYQLPPHLLHGVLAYVEREYETVADTELGDFLNDLAKLVIVAQNNPSEADNLHQLVQDLLDDYEELNEDMLVCVGSHMQHAANTVKQHLVA